jgi:hypothetical protein
LKKLDQRLWCGHWNVVPDLVALHGNLQSTGLDHILRANSFL